MYKAKANCMTFIGEGHEVNTVTSNQNNFSKKK